MPDPLRDIQAEFFRRLSQDAFLTKETGEPMEAGAPREVVDVYDFVPEDAQAPYVVIGEAEFDDDSDKDQDGQLVTMTIHHWSEYRGMNELRAMMARVYALLHRQEFTTDNFQVISLECSRSFTMKDPDRITQHGIQKFRLLVTDAATA